MNIFFIDPMMGGSLAIYDMSLLTNLTRDCKVTVLGSSLFDGEMPYSMKMYPIFTYNHKVGIKKILSYLFSLWKIFKLVKNARPEIIHIQWLKIHVFDSWFYLFLQKRFGAKIVFTAHNILPHDTGEKYAKVYGKFYNKVDAIIVHDKCTHNQLCTKFGVPVDHVHVLPHGLILFKGNEDRVEAEKKDFVERYGISEDTMVFSSMGVQGYYKGTDVLIDVWAGNEELRNNPKCALVLAGQCKNLDLSRLSGLSKVIIENGLLPDDRFNAIMCRTDVLVLPYRQISQSGVNMTAMYFKIPVLVADVGGLADPIRKADIGWVISHCDKALLEDMLLQLVRHPEETLKKKNDNEEEWSKVQETYSWERIGESTSELYKQLLK